MKKTILIILTIAALGLVGCDCDDCVTNTVILDNGPPPVPQGVYSITGDESVAIHWLEIDDVEGDFDFYIVYRSNHPDTGYWPIDSTTNDYSVDNDVTNGQTYYYAVSSIDDGGRVSDLSYENVFDTPRPDGINRRLYDYNNRPDGAGWDFSAQVPVAYNSINSDFYIEYFVDNQIFYINVANVDTDIQDMGYTDDLDEINYSPDAGWSSLGWLEVIIGHTYVIWTDDNHFAKIRVTTTDMADSSVVIDWAYQVDVGNPELKPLVNPKPDITRPDNYLRLVNVNQKDTFSFRKNAGGDASF
ncbi:MAG: hypothetical protein KAR42_09530 [candidate division Zixibacteria bacterium]|nr:hypothetical protein [candidate division Zixibacteria bacterium]